VLGPFHAQKLPEKANCVEITENDPGDTPLLVICTVKYVHGNTIEGVTVETRETDSEGIYDIERPSHDVPDGRCYLTSDILHSSMRRAGEKDVQASGSPPLVASAHPFHSSTVKL
jgi:protocatechuate 3,4-dioxygenase beta subunit